MTTLKTLTVNQITSLCNEAAAAGDTDMVWTCQRAMGCVDSTATAAQRTRIIRVARADVVRAIRNAEAQA